MDTIKGPAMNRNVAKALVITGVVLVMLLTGIPLIAGNPQGVFVNLMMMGVVLVGTVIMAFLVIGLYALKQRLFDPFDNDK